MQEIHEIKRPSERSQSNLSNLISNTQSLVSDESDWVHCGPDLAALGRTPEHGWLNTFIEDALNTISTRLTMVSVSYMQIQLLPRPVYTLSRMQSFLLTIFSQLISSTT